MRRALRQPGNLPWILCHPAHLSLLSKKTRSLFRELAAVGTIFESKRKIMKGGKGDSHFTMVDDERTAVKNFAQIPTSFGHELRACLRCRLVKTYDQFRESGCENCPFLDMEKDHDNVVNCTTPNFNGIISVIDRERSWAGRWLRIGRFLPGCYTLAVSEELPGEFQNICAENNVQYVPPRKI